MCCGCLPFGHTRGTRKRSEENVSSGQKFIRRFLLQLKSNSKGCHSYEQDTLLPQPPIFSRGDQNGKDASRDVLSVRVERPWPQSDSRSQGDASASSAPKHLGASVTHCPYPLEAFPREGGLANFWRSNFSSLPGPSPPIESSSLATKTLERS
jgi:hypothetical protein